MLSYFLISLAVLTTSASAKEGGQDVGHGGDVVECRSDHSNSFSGMVSLDYILTSDKGNQDVVPVSSWQASMYRIRKTLELKVPELLPSFDDFNRYIRSEDLALPRRWEGTDLELVDIKDEAILKSSVVVPDNCRREGKIAIIQALIRQFPETSGSKQIVYKYMPKMFDRLEKEAALQLSFLLVHEWLWDVSLDVSRNRSVNRFFHSTDFDRLSAQEVRASLRGLGLEVESIPRIVARDGSGNFQTLTQALENHRDGETLIVKPGVYQEAFPKITRPVKIIGDGNPEDIVIETDDGVRISTPGAVLKNLTIKRSVFSVPGRGNGFQQAIEILRGSAIFDRVKIDGGAYGLVLGEEVALDFQNGAIKTERVAVTMQRRSSARFLNNETEANAPFAFDDEHACEFNQGPCTSTSSNIVEIIGNTFYRAGRFRGHPHPKSVVRDNRFIPQGQ